MTLSQIKKDQKPALFDKNIKLAQNNNRSFFCLLFFSNHKSKRSGSPLPLMKI